MVRYAPILAIGLILAGALCIVIFLLFRVKNEISNYLQVKQEMELPTITVTPPAPPGEAAPAPVPALAPGPKPEDKVVELGEEQVANMFLWVSGAKFWHPKFQKAEKERRKRILRGLR